MTITPTESYSAAVQLHNQEFRALGERTAAFVIVQSIFLPAFGMILINPHWFPHAAIIILWGINIFGALFCLFHHLAGGSGSRAAYSWRKYMLVLEGTENATPWKWLYNEYYRQRELEESYISSRWSLCKLTAKLLSRFRDERRLLDRTPLPIAWIMIPSLFIAIWFGIGIYITTRMFMASDPLLAYPIMPILPYQIISIAILVGIAAIMLIFICGYVKWRSEKQIELESSNKQPSENMVRAKCKHCGEELQPDHTGPCPKCGKTGKNVVASSSVAIGIKASASATHSIQPSAKSTTLFGILVAIVMAVVCPIILMVPPFHIVVNAAILVGFLLLVFVIAWWQKYHIWGLIRRLESALGGSKTFHSK